MEGAKKWLRTQVLGCPLFPQLCSPKSHQELEQELFCNAVKTSFVNETSFADKTTFADETSFVIEISFALLPWLAQLVSQQVL